MPFVFHCPTCGAAHSAGEPLIGRQVRCPKCGDVVVVSRPKPVRQKPARPAPAAAPAGSSRGPDEERFDLPKREAVEASMDMTPMVDVTFQLLIFFMVTAAFAMQKSIEIPKPEQDEQLQAQPVDPEVDPNSILVRIDQNNTFQILHETIAPEDSEAGSEQELLQKLRYAQDTAPGGSPPSRLLVQAHGDAHHEYVVLALDAGTAIGMEQVQLMTVEEME